MRGSVRYLCWLMNQAGVDAEGPDGYLELCGLLQRTDFMTRIDMDENRVRNAEDLRMEWAETETPDEVEQTLLADAADEAFGDQCSLLELMVYLAREMRYEMLDSEFEAGTGKWFKEMLCNCGLDEMTNEVFAERQEEAEDILGIINQRKFGWDGEGGFFPLNYPLRDQRRIEIVDQMNDYLAENYDIC